MLMKGYLGLLVISSKADSYEYDSFVFSECECALYIHSLFFLPFSFISLIV